MLYCLLLYTSVYHVCNEYSWSKLRALWDTKTNCYNDVIISYFECMIEISVHL